MGFFRKWGHKLRNMLMPYGAMWDHWTGNSQKGIQRQIEIGNRMLREGPFLYDSACPTHVNRIFERVQGPLQRHLRKFPWNLNVKIWEHSYPNACALPGGVVLVSPSLVAMCQTDEELAFVLSHEIGHVVRNHIISKLANDVTASVLTSCLLRNRDPQLGEVVKKLCSSGYSQELEHDADCFATRLVWAAWFEPRRAVRILDRLHALEIGSQTESIVASHPPIKDRIKEIESYIQSDPKLAPTPDLR